MQNALASCKLLPNQLEGRMRSASRSLPFPVLSSTPCLLCLSMPMPRKLPSTINLTLREPLYLVVLKQEWPTCGSLAGFMGLFQSH